MTDYPDYNRATNAAYELLYKYQGRLPVVDVFSLIDLLPRDIKVIVRTYTQMAEKMNCSFKEFYRDYASSEHGFTMKKGNKHYICFNEHKDEKTVRFTIAHEIGHIILGHTEDDTVARREADCFARNLLCPIQIADGFNVTTQKEYIDCFNISEPMAEATVNWRGSDRYYITKENYNRFNDVVYSYFSGYTLPELYGYSGY